MKLSTFTLALLAGYASAADYNWSDWSADKSAPNYLGTCEAVIGRDHGHFYMAINNKPTGPDYVTGHFYAVVWVSVQVTHGDDDGPVSDMQLLSSSPSTKRWG
jgi:hypothetical protein